MVTLAERCSTCVRLQPYSVMFGQVGKISQGLSLQSLDEGAPPGQAIAVLCYGRLGWKDQLGLSLLVNHAERYCTCVSLQLYSEMLEYVGKIRQGFVLGELDDRCSTRVSSGLHHKYQKSLKRLIRIKRSSLLVQMVGGEEKMYYDVYTSGGGTQQRIRDCVLPKTDDFFCDGDAREIRKEFDKSFCR